MASEVLEHRIADRRVLRLIQKWLAAGVIEDGEWSKTEAGTAQGASVSPLLSNVFLHYVFDRWANQWRRRNARGDVILVRFADDYVAGFERREDAERFLADLRERFAEFGLELHPEKTRLIEFGRFAVERRERRGLRKPETFTFLGFTHICATNRSGGFKLKRVTSKKKMHAKLKSVKTEMRKRMVPPDPRTGTLARQRPARALQLLRSARQQRGHARLPTTGHLALAIGAHTPQPERPDHLEADRPPRCAMATPTPHPSPLARRALRRQNPREEPSALTRTLGSVRGAFGNGRPYRDCSGRVSVTAAQSFWAVPTGWVGRQQSRRELAAVHRSDLGLAAHREGHAGCSASSPSSRSVW